VAPGLAYRRLGIVNVAFLKPAGAGDRGRVLVDAGLDGCAGAIARAAADRFGEGARPAAIVMTHGHFDHVGALEHLAPAWDAPDGRWLHAPGHTPGQVALWREADRTLLSGDAVITTRQEAAYAVALQSPEIQGPRPTSAPTGTARVAPPAPWPRSSPR
jgi:glyoxylase-like metal-dependent hydrolase (beta-lactamase superfamily II)